MSVPYMLSIKMINKKYKDEQLDEKLVLIITKAQ